VRLARGSTTTNRRQCGWATFVRGLCLMVRESKVELYASIRRDLRVCWDWRWARHRIKIVQLAGSNGTG
jgi:hypothetical protein